MTSMTTSQQTDRSGTDEIPGPRGGQGVRLLVLGADADAQELRNQAQAAGFELAQRYSARVSHVAYGSGIDPEDTRYAKIRGAGLPLLPLQKCAEQLGLGADEAEAVADTHVEAESEAEAPVEAPVAVEAESEVDTDVEPEVDSETDLEVDPEIDDEPLDFPPLPTTSTTSTTSDDEPEVADADLEASEDPDELERFYDHEAESAFIPGFTVEEPAEPDVPLAAAVIGIDPWEGEQAQRTPAALDEPVEIAELAEPTETAEPTGTAESATIVEAAASVESAAPLAHLTTLDTGANANANPVTGTNLAPTSTPATDPTPASHILVSFLWALIPLATFGLLTPVTFGYAAYRLRSRGLALTALVYTLAVVGSFVLSAIHPHASTPADTTGALLTVCLAGTWIGGTLHALSLRTRVFVG